MKKIFVCIVFVVMSIATKAQWDKTTEIIYTANIFNLIKTLGYNDVQSAEYTGCVIARFKTLMPNPSAVSQERAREIGKQAGNECMPKGDIKMQWTPQSEQLIRQYFNGKEELKVLSTDEKDKFNTCVINKLKVLFPKGLTKIPEKEAVKIGEECIKEILDNNEKP